MTAKNNLYRSKKSVKENRVIKFILNKLDVSKKLRR